MIKKSKIIVLCILSISLLFTSCSGQSKKSTNSNETNTTKFTAKESTKTTNESKTFDKVKFNKFMDDTDSILHKIDELVNTTDPSKLSSVNAAIEKVSSINDEIFALKIPDDPTGTVNPYELQSYLSAYNLDFRALLINKQCKLTNKPTDINPVNMSTAMNNDRDLYAKLLAKYREICK